MRVFGSRLLALAGYLILIAAASPAAADLVDVPSKVARWGMGEITLSSDRAYANPVSGVTLSAEFRSPSGKLFHPEGFFDGGHVWKIRIMPDQEGRWTFRTISNDPALSGKSGSFTVTAAGAGDRGPIRVANSYHFAYADGAPYFMLGTTQYGGLIAGAGERERMLGRLQHSAFNKARFMLLGGAFFEGKDVPRPFETGADGKMDLSRPNPAYFREVEKGLRGLQSQHVQADLILFIPYAEALGPGNVSDMGPKADEAYLRYAVARLAAFDNVWWTVANEYDLFKVQKDWNRLGELVSRADPYRHLLSIHHSVLGYYDNRQPWITHVNIQDVTMQRLAKGPRNLGAIALDARAIGKPVVVDEYGYEGDNGLTWGSFSGREIVDMHWSVAMAGAYGSHGESFYGASDALDFVGDSPPRLAFLKEVLSAAPFQDLEPANDVVSYPGQLFAPSVLAKRGSYYLIYFPAPRELADWNTGFFGPATPSKPLPLSQPYGDMKLDHPPVTIKIAPGTYRVDLVDPWLMRITTIGYTSGSEQQYDPHIAPGLLRLTRVDAPPPGETVAPLAQLEARRF